MASTASTSGKKSDRSSRTSILRASLVSTRHVEFLRLTLTVHGNMRKLNFVDILPHVTCTSSNGELQSKIEKSTNQNRRFSRSFQTTFRCFRCHFQCRNIPCFDMITKRDIGDITVKIISSFVLFLASIYQRLQVMLVAPACFARFGQPHKSLGYASA